MADARTSGTAVTRIFSIIEVFGRDEDKAFDYMKKLRANVQVYTKSGGGGTIPVGLGQAGAGIFFIVDALKTQQEGYDVVHVTDGPAALERIRQGDGAFDLVILDPPKFAKRQKQLERAARGF